MGVKESLEDVLGIEFDYFGEYTFEITMALLFIILIWFIAGVVYAFKDDTFDSDEEIEEIDMRHNSRQSLREDRMDRSGYIDYNDQGEYVEYDGQFDGPSRNSRSSHNSSNSSQYYGPSRDSYYQSHDFDDRPPRRN